jgi:hypothetical protein
MLSNVIYPFLNNSSESEIVNVLKSLNMKRNFLKNKNAISFYS